MSCCRVFRINNDVKKRIVVAFGRYQPPHCGHKTIFDDMVSMINDPNNIADEGYIYVKGSVPGPKGSWVLLKDSVKKSLPADIPLPAALKGVKEEIKNNESVSDEPISEENIESSENNGDSNES